VYIIPIASDTNILLVLLAAKLSLLLTHLFRATDYYFDKFVFPNVNIYHWERSNEGNLQKSTDLTFIAKFVHGRKVQVDFIFNVLNETLSMVYYFPIIGVTRYSSYNSEAFPHYSSQILLNVVYYYVCSMGKIGLS
jgi:hypothetical protein